MDIRNFFGGGSGAVKKTPVVASPTGDDSGTADGLAGQHRVGDAGDLRHGPEWRCPSQGGCGPIRAPADGPLIPVV